MTELENNEYHNSKRVKKQDNNAKRLNPHPAIQLSSYPACRDLLIFILIFAAGIFLTINNNIRDGHVRQPGKIWSDAAHYYVYMPATFIYGWDVYRFPYKIEKKFEGFILNDKTGKVEIKTTCGEAILLTPFFLAAHASAYIFKLPMDGFSSFYQVFMLIGCVFYFTLGLFFIKKFLDCYFKHSVALISVLIVALTSQIYYYAYEAALMSHVYSFFLFSAFIYLLKKYLEGGKRSYTLFSLLSLSLALAVLLRPTNVLIILWMAFLDLKSARELWQRILFFLNPKRSLIYILIQFAVLIPQFLYWNYLSGHYIYFSYPGEVFFWGYPMLLQVWFSPFNGLFPYHPLWVLLLTGIGIMIWRRKLNGLFSLVFFLLASYVFSCWHCWFYGGSFGFRPLAEFIVFMALPLGWLIMAISRWKNLFLKSSMVFLFLILVYFNLMQFYNYNVFTGGMWSWDDFFIKLKNYELVDYPQKTYTWKTDFSNIYGYEPIYQTWKHPHSRVIASYCDKGIPDNAHYKRRLSAILDHPVHKLSLSVWVYSPDSNLTHASWICRIDSAGSLIFFKTLQFDDFVKKKDIYTEVHGTMDIPEWVDQNTAIHFYIRNTGGKEFYFDDMSIKFE
ncbi:MAG: hypothetical protein NTW31_09235 [Bacteroidetes bacterium]|nr:hypothetical protein [Bacteroidota bacterium]